MDKQFFASLDDALAGFASRAGVDDEIEAVVVLHSGRTIAVERVVDAADGHVQIDGRSLSDDENRPISIVLPYHQISHLQLGPARPRPGQAGFRLAGH